MVLIPPNAASFAFYVVDKNVQNNSSYNSLVAHHCRPLPLWGGSQFSSFVYQESHERHYPLSGWNLGVPHHHHLPNLPAQLPPEKRKWGDTAITCFEGTPAALCWFVFLFLRGAHCLLNGMHAGSLWLPSHLKARRLQNPKCSPFWKPSPFSGALSRGSLTLAMVCDRWTITEQAELPCSPGPGPEGTWTPSQPQLAPRPSSHWPWAPIPTQPGYFSLSSLEDRSWKRRATGVWHFVITLFSALYRRLKSLNLIW